MPVTSLRTLAALLALGTAPVAALGAQVVIGPRTNAIPVSASGDTITVPVVVDMTAGGGASLGSVTARLSWRAATLRLIGTSAGTFAAPVVNATPGELRFAAASVSGATGTPTIINALFETTGPIGDTTTLQMTIDEMTAAGTLAPITPVSTAALVCVGSVGGVWGDVNGDATVNSADALVIVTNAVGLSIAPFTVVNGDVDSSGTVSSRDALIVLSHAVGLNVTQFRVGQVRASLCGTGTPPASATLTPGTVQLRPGDRLPLALVARDASSAIVHTPAISWTSLTPAVATVDSVGAVTAVAAGTATIVGAVAPGVTASATITVNPGPPPGSRVWYVSAAHSNPVEHGSQAYPFSSVRVALDSAAAGDTVRIAVAEYGEPLRIVRPVTVLGDSNSTGFPRIRPTAGAAISVDSVGTGAVILRRLEMPNTEGAVRAQGGGGLLELDRLRISGSRAAAISARGFGTLLVTGSQVHGAGGAGLDVDSTTTLLVSHSVIDLVTAPGVSAIALKAMHGTSATVDTSTLLGGGAEFAGISQVLIARSRLAGTGAIAALRISQPDSVNIFASEASGTHGGVFIDVAPGGAVVADSLRIAGDEGFVTFGGRAIFARRLSVQRTPGLQGPGVAISDADTAHLAQGSIGGGLTIQRTTITPVDVRLDTMHVRGTVFVNPAGRLFVHGGVLEGGDDQAIDVTGFDRFHMTGVEVRQTRLVTPSFSFGPHAIAATSTDTVTIDSVHVHDNAVGGLSVTFADSLLVTGSRFVTNFHSAGSGSPTVIHLHQVRSSRIARTLVDQRTGAAFAGLYVTPPAIGATTVLDTNQWLGSMSFSSYIQGLGAASIDTVVVRGSVYAASGIAVPSRVYGIFAANVQHAVVADNTVDSVSQHGIAVTAVNATVSNNVVRTASDPLTVQHVGAPGQVLVTGNTVFCDGSQAGGQQGIQINVAQPTVSANAVNGCMFGIMLNQGGLTPAPAIVRQNTVALQARGQTGLSLQGVFTNVEVVLNDLTSADTVNNVALSLQPSGGWAATRVDSNAVHDIRGHGIDISGTFGSLSLRGNDVRRLRSLHGSPVAGISITAGNNGATLRNNAAVDIKGYGLMTNGISGHLTLDGNLFADDSLSGALLGGVNSMTGRYNRFSRNQIGLEGGFGGTIDSSAFEGNTVAGVGGGSSVIVADNWWGHSNGPRCGAACPTADPSADSVQSNLTFTPFLADTAAGTPAGVAPMQPGAPAGLRAGAPVTRIRLAPVAAPSAAIIAERQRLAARAREERP